MSTKAFGIDFNWDTKGPAFPGMFAEADPVEHLRWLKDLGANVVQTFCVSYNGYAWYAGSRVAPVLPGLKHDFLQEMTGLAHSVRPISQPICRFYIKNASPRHSVPRVTRWRKNCATNWRSENPLRTN